MTFYVLQTLSFVILELPPHRLKCVTHCNIRILMGMALGMLMLGDEMSARTRDLDAHLIDAPLKAVFVWQRDDHMTLDDMGVKFEQALRKLPDARAESGRRLDIPPSDAN